MLSLSALGQQPAFLTNGLVAYYPFDGNANDASGNSFHGIDHSITTAKDRFGNKSGSISFDGINSFIEVPSFSSQRFTGQLTISFWFNEDVDHDGLDHYILSTVSSSPAYSGFDVFFMTRNDELPPAGLWFREFGGKDDGTAVSVADFNLIQTNIWHNAIYILKGTSAAIYIDGKIISPWKSSMPFELVDNGIPMLIGKGVWRQWLDSFYKGQLDDIRIYNRAMSSDEVAYLYQYESQPAAPRGATATAKVVNGFVVGIGITDPGYGYINTPSVILAGGGSGATALATISNSIVTGIAITSPGSGYTNVPLVLIDAPPTPTAPAREAVASATQVGGFVVGVNVTDGGSGYINVPNVNLVGGGGTGASASAALSNSAITAITITNPGHGYTNAPTVVIEPPTHQAVATATEVGGFVVGVTLIDGGGGYVTIPSVQLVGGGGIGATATATVANTAIATISITNPGRGYTNAPSVIIAPPPFPPHAAIVTAQVVNGFVVGLTVVDGGRGYTEKPTVTFTGGGGTGASAIATVDNGTILSLSIRNPGSGYTTIPTVNVPLGAAPVPPAVLFTTGLLGANSLAISATTTVGLVYQWQSSSDLKSWFNQGNPFTATTQGSKSTFGISSDQQYYRIINLQ